MYKITKIFKLTLIFIFPIIIIFIFKFLYIIPEGKIGVCLRLGNLKKKNNKEIIYNPGLNFKIPYIEKVYIFDSNYKIKNIKNKIKTLDNIFINIEIFIEYEIKDYYLYYIYNNKKYYRHIIKNKVNNYIKEIIKKNTLKKILTDNDNISIFIKNFLKKHFNNEMIIKKVYINKIELLENDLNTTLNQIKKNKELECEKNILTAKKISEKIIEKTKNDKYKLNLITKQKINKLNNDTNLKIYNMLEKFYKKDKIFFNFIEKINIYKKIINKKDIIILDNKIFQK